MTASGPSTAAIARDRAVAPEARPLLFGIDMVLRAWSEDCLRRRRAWISRGYAGVEQGWRLSHNKHLRSCCLVGLMDFCVFSRQPT